MLCRSSGSSRPGAGTGRVRANRPGRALHRVLEALYGGMPERGTHVDPGQQVRLGISTRLRPDPVTP